MIITNPFKTQSKFEFQVVTAGADTFQLPIYSGGTYSFHVDWGDGNDDIITAWNDAAANHSYAGAGTWEVKISGTLTGWRFNNVGDKTLIADISNWGILRLGNLNGYFYGCTNLTISATDSLVLTGVTTFLNTFRGCTSLTTNAAMDNWNVSSATAMNNIFNGCTSFDQDISSWDVSNVTNFQNAFKNCTVFNQDISSWNVSKVTNFVNTFDSATAFNQDIGSWTTSAATSLNAMLVSATNFNQDISGWDIADVTTMVNMMSNSAFNSTNYDLLLVAWEGQVEKTSVAAHFGTATYGAGAPATARGVLVSTSSWTITDGGPT